MELLEFKCSLVKKSFSTDLIVYNVRFRCGYITMWQFLVSPLIPYFFCSIILAIFFYMWLRYSCDEKKLVEHSITKFLEILEKINNRDEFYEQYELISSQFLEEKVFHNSWSEFTETVIIDVDSNRIITTKRPNDYFNEHSIISPHINLRLLHAVPNYLVGLGLLFTFIGLIAAIHFAALGLGSADGGQEALKNLLQMASVKFWSSIAGLFCSILLSIIQKKWLNNLNKKIYAICRKIEELTDSITIEQLLNHD